MLSLMNFEQQIDPKLLKSGMQYYQNGSIISIEESENGHWVSEVEGSDIYNVEVNLENYLRVSDYFCSCPYDDGICKHIIAVLFSIREITRKPKGERTGASKKINFENLIQKIPLKDYQDFIRQYASHRKAFKTEFILWFASWDNEIDVDKYYDALIKNLIRKHERRGFIDFRATYRLSHEVDKLLQTGSGHIARNNFREAFAVAKSTLTSMIEVMAYCDDSDANIATTISEAIGLIETIINDKRTSADLKEQVYHFFMVELNNRIYFDFGDFGYDLVVLFGQLAISLKAGETFLRFLDNMISVPAVSLGSYTSNFFKLQKIAFLKNTGRTDESEKLVHQNMDMVEVRQGEVEKALLKKDFPTAKKLISGGIKIAESKRHPGTIEMWNKELLRIALLQKDMSRIRYYSKYFAFDRGFNKEYYHQWKKTYAEEEWNKIIEEFIDEKVGQIQRDEVGNKGKVWYTPHLSLLESLAPIYIEEKNWDRLWELVAKTNEFDIAWKYHECLVKKYPVALLELYVKGIEEKANRASQRSECAELVRKMKKISNDIIDGREKMAMIAQRLIVRYPRRPAMIDELRKF